MTSNTSKITKTGDVEFSEVQPISDSATWFVNPADQAAVNAAIQTYYTKNNNSYPTWAQFLKQLAADNVSAAQQTSITTSFHQGYRFLLDTNPGVARDAIDTTSDVGGDLSGLNTAGVVTSANINTQFQAAFNFLTSNLTTESTTFDTKTNTTISAKPSDTPALFQNGLTNFMTRGVSLQQSSITPDNNVATSYEQIYDAYFPPGDQAKTPFATLMTKFAQQQVAQKGFFVPTQAINQWGAFLQQSANTSIITQQTTLSSIGSKKVLILSEIFAILAKLVNTIQEVAAVQSDRLTLYTNWQQAYTNQISQIPVFYIGDGTTLGNFSDTTATNQQNSLNTKSSSDKDRLTAQRQALSNTSSAQQASVNQSTDAVTQQANFASSILQQLSTLLSSIFR